MPLSKQGDALLSRLVRRELKDICSLDMYRGCAAEFVGMVLLSFMAVGTGLSNPGNSTAIAIEAGFFIACAIRTFSTVSGGHVNPAISLGFLLLGQISFVRFVLYSVIQTIGSATGTALLKAIAPTNLTENALGIIYPAPGITDMQALVCEMVITFFLLFGTFAMIDPQRDDINGFAPFQIGLIVVINIFATFNISGGCMNPARNFGPAMVAGVYDKMWIYWVGDMLGALIGALLYDKVFSTSVCRNWLRSTGCMQRNKNEKALENGTKLNYKKRMEDSDLEI